MKIISVLILLLSCRSSRTNNSFVQRTEDKDFYFYEQHSPDLYFALMGDYKFQEFKTKYFRDADRRFIKYASGDFNNHSPAILFSAHTIVQPYYSIVCTGYKSTSADTVAINEIKLILKKQLKTSFSVIEKINFGSRVAYKITYQTMNNITGIYTSNREYFFSEGGNMYRLFVWTTNEDDRVLENEAEYIIKEAKFGK